VTSEPTTIGFRSGAGVIVVDVVAPEASPAVDAFFPDDRAAAGDSAPRFILEREGPGYRIRTEGGAWQAPDLPAILTRLELMLAETLVVERGLTGVHAAGVALGGGAVLFAGAGESGKSSLTAGFAVRGHAVFGDDVVFLEHGRVHGFRRLIKVEEPARSLLGLPQPEGPLSTLWDEAALYHPLDLGTEWAEPADLRAVVLPTRSGGPPLLQPIAPARALLEMMTGIVMRARLGAADFDLVADAVERVPCYVLTFEETTEAVELLSAELG